MKWCKFGFHKWSKWIDKETYDKPSIWVEGVYIGKYLVQESRCEKCNTIRFQEIRLLQQE